jgi:hypothetical protein
MMSSLRLRLAIFVGLHASIVVAVLRWSEIGIASASWQAVLQSKT